jgi:hypothetical protein
VPTKLGLVKEVKQQERGESADGLSRLRSIKPSYIIWAMLIIIASIGVYITAPRFLYCMGQPFYSVVSCNAYSWYGWILLIFTFYYIYSVYLHGD